MRPQRKKYSIDQDGSKAHKKSLNSLNKNFSLWSFYVPKYSINKILSKMKNIDWFV